MTIRKTSKGGITRYLSEPRAASAAAPAPVATAASPANTAGERHTPPLRINRNLLERFGRNPNETRMPERRFEAFAPAKHPPQVEAEVPTDDRLAMDDALVEYANGAVQPYASDLFFNGLIAEGQAFLGFPYLAMLAQRAEYRRMSERFATEMTRKWIKLKASGDEDYTDKLKEIDEELKRLGAKLKFREAAEHDAFFGRGHIVFDFGTGKGLDRDELATPIGDGRDAASQLKVEKGSLKRIVVVEPVWMYPMAYNTTDPLSEDFYKPTIWNTQGRQIHASRVMTFVGREVPDLLKAAYSFGGLSLTQMAKPYVDNWLRTRQAVTDLVESFSVSGLMTDLSAVLAGGEGDIVGRVDFYNATRSNRGMMLIDKDREEFFNISTPLSGLDHLQAQSLEQLSAVSGIPLVILLGITPSGLNASSEGEIRAFQDLVHAHQELLFGDNLRTLLRVVQMSLFGEVFPDIGFEFVDLGGLSEKEQAEIRKIDAETANVYMDAGVISAGEERERIANDEHTIYPAIDPEDVPDVQDDEQDDLNPDAPNDGGEEDGEGEEGDTRGADLGGGRQGARPLAGDAWNEGDHPRDGGKFSTKQGAGAKGEAKAEPKRTELSPHPVEKMRDYAPKELDWEYGVEYLKYSKPAFPDAFSSREDFQQKLDAAPMRPLTGKEFKELGNSMAAQATGKSEEWLDDTFGHRRDPRRIADELRNGKTAPPIVLQKDGKLRLMAGQTRLAVGAALGIAVPVKIIDVSKRAQDKGEWDEAKHPRDKGKFASKAGAGAESSSGETTFKTKKEHVAHLLSKGTTTKEILKATGWPSVTVPGQAASLGMKLTKTKNADGEIVYKGTPMTDEEKAQVQQIAKQAKAKKVEALPTVLSMKIDDVPPASKVEHMNAGVSLVNAPAAKSEPTTPKGGPNILAAQKFKENTKGKKLAPIDRAKEIVKAVAQTGGDAKLAESMMGAAEKAAVANDFHKTVESMFNSAAKHVQNAENAKAQEVLHKAKLEKEAAKLKAEMADPATAAHYEVLKGIGAAQSIDHAKAKVKAAGLDGVVTPHEAAQIIAYSGSHYGPVNKQLREGVLNKEQWAYTKALDAALSKLPKKPGVTVRGTTLPAAELAKYQPGMVVEERAFTSTGVGKKFSGPHTFEIHGKSGRDISKLSKYPGEKEVLFPSASRFEVVSRTGNHIVLKEVDYLHG